MKPILSIFALSLMYTLPVSAQWIKASDYGALCNGTANDAPAIQAAINAAQLFSAPLYGNGTVLLPPGVCYLSTYSGMPNSNDLLLITAPITLLGVSKLGTVLETNSSFAQNVIGVALTPAPPAQPPSPYYPEIGTLSINLGTNYQASAVSLSNVSFGGLIHDLYITGGNYGIYDSASSGYRIRSCQFVNQATASILHNGDGGSEVNIDDSNIFHDSTTQAQTAGIQYHRGTNVDTGGLYITNTRVNQSHVTGTAALNYGVQVWADSWADVFLFIRSTIIDSTTGPALNLQNVGNGYIRDSWLVTASGAAVALTGAWLFEFDHNEIRSGNSSGYLVDLEAGPQDIHFEGNQYCCSGYVFNINTGAPPLRITLGPTEHLQTNLATPMTLISAAQKTAFWANTTSPTSSMTCLQTVDSSGTIWYFTPSSGALVGSSVKPAACGPASPQ